MLLILISWNTKKRSEIFSILQSDLGVNLQGPAMFHQHSRNVFTLLYQYSSNIPAMLQQCSRSVPAMFQQYPRNILAMFQQ